MLPTQLLNQNAQFQNQVQFQQEENRKLEDRIAALEALLPSDTTAAAVTSRRADLRSGPSCRAIQIYGAKSKRDEHDKSVLLGRALYRTGSAHNHRTSGLPDSRVAMVK